MCLHIRKPRGQILEGHPRIGEAIGAKMEIALNEYLKEFVDNFHCHLVSKGPLNPKTKKHKKLLLYDNFGTAYNLDAVVANEAM